MRFKFRVGAAALRSLPFFSPSIKSFLYTAVVLVVAIATCLFPAVLCADDAGNLPLAAGWAVQSSAKTQAAGQGISQSGYAAVGWYPTSVPSTVFAALVANNVYPDPDFGMNLRSVPGVAYKIGANFSHQDMPKDSPFRVSWWYRTEFDLPRTAWFGRTIWLNFHGINYRANIWMNGRQLANSDDVAGAFRRYEFDVTSFARPGARNALAVEVFPPTPHDLAITFVDWNPLPPDKDMGIWQAVFLTSSGPVTVRNAQVVTALDPPDFSTAHLTVSADLHNTSDHAMQGTVRGTITRAVGFSQDVTLAPGETKRVTFAPDHFDQLNITGADLWWPYGMGAPHLQRLHIEFAQQDEISDAQNIQFGISEITSELSQGHRLFKVNGKKVLIRGGGWTSEMLLRDTTDRWRKDFDYVKGMNLNTVRLEGKLMDDGFFDLADRYGILVMAGWCCCDHWEQWGHWKSDEQTVATASLRDQALRLRSHPSVFVWLDGSDNPPPQEVESAYIAVLKRASWPKPVLSSAQEKPTRVTGPTGVKMTGPYDYVPPDYWLQDTRHGGAFGFNTETSPGPAIPPVETLKQMLGADHLWPIDEVWDYHAGGGEFKNLDRYNKALTRRYGPAKDLQDYLWKSQAIAYEGERAMFEAFALNKYNSTGVIQWMLNNAWPSLIWHLYDYYWRPAGGYFGVQRACEPLHAQYSYSDKTVSVVNSFEKPFSALTLVAKVYDINAHEQYSHEQKVDVDADAVAPGFAVPDQPGISVTYFLKLTLTDSSGQLLSSNFYWLSTKPDTLSWGGSNWYYTPQSAYADLTLLSQLPHVDLTANATFSTDGNRGIARVHIQNPSTTVAFLARARLTKGKGGDDVSPVLWDDNYVSLLPGEQRDLGATYMLEDLGGSTPAVEIDGWNVNRQ